MLSPRSLSLRSKFILIVLCGAVLPLALLGLWLTRTAERSGQELLRGRLDISQRQIVDEIGLRWLGRRSQLLQLADCSAVQAASGSTTCRSWPSTWSSAPAGRSITRRR